MKKIFSITILCLVLMFGSSFKTETPAPAPATVPPYSMVDITGLNNFDAYAIKVKCFGLLWDDLSTPLSDEFSVNNPDDTSIWNMSHKYYCTINYTDVIIYVYIKLTSQSSWSFYGAMATWETAYVTSTIYDHFLSLISFSIYDVPAE